MLKKLDDHFEEAVPAYLPARLKEITCIVAQVVFLLFAASAW